MVNYENMILAIDISSNSVKVGLVAEGLKLVHFNSQNINIINEDIDGFVKSFDMEDIWNKLVNGVNQVLTKIKNQNTKINISDKNIETKDIIPFGHKFAIRNIKKGSSVIKYGEVIGTSSEDISEGDWIHIHNITSSYLKVINNE